MQVQILPGIFDVNPADCTICKPVRLRIERPKDSKKAGSLPDFGSFTVSVRSLRIPSYRLHKPTGRAVVTLSGRDHYLGEYGTPESRAEYDRLVAEWLAYGRTLPRSASANGSDLTVNELLLKFVEWAESYYRKGGRVTGEVSNIKYAVRTLRELYGSTPARDFGPIQLKTTRQAVIETGLCRNEVNRRTRIVVRAFKWAVSEGMIPPSVHHGLCRLEPTGVRHRGLPLRRSGDDGRLPIRRPLSGVRQTSRSDSSRRNQANPRGRAGAVQDLLLGIQYGMGAASLAVGSASRRPMPGVAPAPSGDLPEFWRWSDGAESHAMLLNRLHTVFGWTVRIGPDANPRSLRNFPCQANGAEMLRLACCLATERGVSSWPRFTMP